MQNIKSSSVCEQAAALDELVHLSPEQVAGDHFPWDRHGALGGKLHVHIGVEGTHQVSDLKMVFNVIILS